MASLQKRNGSYRVLFTYRNKLHSFTLGKVERSEAEAKAQQVDYLLMRLKQKLLAVPEGVDIVTFVEFDGKAPRRPTMPESPRLSVTVTTLKDRYLATLGNGSVEANSLDTYKLHLSHICRYLGAGFPLAELTLGRLQEYVNDRATKGISPYTIRKEITTFKGAWNWGGPMKLTHAVLPNKALRYPKLEEKPPFSTKAEIVRQIAAGGDPDSWWESLYLTASELGELLALVKARAIHSWIYPLFCFAGHTGARRSELLRASVADVDFASNTVLIREKKRNP